MHKLVSLLKVTCLVAVGLVAGMGLHAWSPEGTPLIAQDKQTLGPEEQIRKLKIELPAVTKPTNTLVNAVRVGDLLFVSGTGPGQVNGQPLRKAKPPPARWVCTSSASSSRSWAASTRSSAWSKPSAW
jgi:hypothetical protein